MSWRGRIISGDFDIEMNEFTVLQVKHLSTESTLNENQMTHLYKYLVKHRGEADGQIMTLDDQMLIHLSKEDLDLLLNDLDVVKTMYIH